jgi:hypothetical protein
MEKAVGKVVKMRMLAPPAPRDGDASWSNTGDMAVWMQEANGFLCRWDDD